MNVLSNPDLHRLSAIAYKQRCQLCSDQVSRFQVDGVFVKGVFDRPTFT